MQKATDNSNAASAEAPCPVQVLMKQISGLDAAYCELCDLDDGPTNDEKTDIWEANRILRDLVSITRAESLQGGLFQLTLAAEETGLMTENLPAFASTSDPEIRAIHLHIQRQGRLLNSVAHVLRRIIGDQAADEAVGGAPRSLREAGQPAHD